MDLTLYCFRFPVSISVVTCAMLSSIGGAALFTPIFILGFPLLGPEYILHSTLATQLMPESEDMINGTYFSSLHAQVLGMAGRREESLAELERLINRRPNI